MAATVEHSELTAKTVSIHEDYVAPDGSEIRLLVTGRYGGLCYCSPPAGRVSSPVRHRTVEELWYTVSGKGRVWRALGAEEVMLDVGQGQSLRIPVGTSFEFRNDGSEPLCFLICTMPPWPGADEAIPVSGPWAL